jgi:two-component system chemotaxis response regulator CheB
LEALDFGAVDFIPKARRAELIHEKLLAAASANIGLRRSVPLTPLPPPPPMPINIHHRAPQAPAAFAPASPPSAATTGLPPLVRKFQAAPVNAPRPNTRLVLIGSSTGGPQALQQVVSQLPDNLTAPVVIAQHMPPQFTLALAKRLDETCPPKVVEAENGMPLHKGTVYIAQGGMHLRVAQDHLCIDPDKGESLYKPSVDVLGESALHAFGKNVLGVMLTGMGNDGTRAFVQLHRAGAYNISQDAESCVVYGMPRSVVEAGASDEVAPLSRIGQRIREMLGMPGSGR